MKRKITAGMVVIIVLIFMGCATTYRIGEFFKTDHLYEIEIGETNQEEIITMFGLPWRKGISNGNYVYIYSHEEITFKTDDTVIKKGNTLLIEFDEHKIVKNYYLNIPGKETLLFGYLLHKHHKEKEDEETQQHQIAIRPIY